MIVRKVRVLVVDDSAVIRRLLTDILSSDPSIEVVGTAANGSIALAKIPQVVPDVVTLDVEMPDMNGLDVLAEVRRTYRWLPVIMFSSVTERAAATTLQALALGATDYVTKPSQLGGLDAAVQHVREQLVPKIRGLCAVDTPPATALRSELGPPSPLGPVAAVAAPPGTAPVGILAVGASTGGPQALSSLFADLPRTLSVPVVIVQHMPPLFTKLLADRLSSNCPMAFHEARDGDRLEPGHAWIAPGDHHMRVVRDASGARIAIDQAPPENSCRPAVDVLFRSVAAAFGPAALAVVLTGMGQDGLRGCQQVREQAGQIVVQDQASSVVWGMPGFVAKAGLAQAVLPLSHIAAEVLRRISRLSNDGAMCRAV
jgi:two-component system, chemotaxis family, protein-glutamate methylesterase/glutaminase